jgi:GxxExxY protein
MDTLKRTFDIMKHEQYSTDGYETLETMITAAAKTVLDAVGSGQSELVYQRSLAIELRLQGFSVQEAVEQTVYYRGFAVGHMIIDMLVKLTDNEYMVLELKAVDTIPAKDRLQIRKYMNNDEKYRIGFLINFAIKAESVKMERFDK